MFNVNSKKSIALLSKRLIKYNKTRNIISVIAIMLTTILFTSVFSITISINESIQNSTMRMVGTKAHGGFKFMTLSQYEKLKADTKIKDISYNIIVGFGENPEFKKTYVEIRFSEEKAAKWCFNMPTTGTLPKSKMDIATTTDVLDALGLPHEIGIQVPIEFTSNGIKHKDVFTLCGFWERDIASYANEAFVSREYCDEVAPIKKGESIIDETDFSGSINPLIWFKSSWNIEKQMEELKNRCGFDNEVNDGINWAYTSSEVDLNTIFLLLCAIFLIMFSGYLIIYNIFYISVSKDIRFYGLLKTIGTTNRQLKKIVRRQGFLLCLIGIPMGLFIGYILSFVLVPAVLEVSDIAENDYCLSINPIIFIGGGLFAFLTVLISCIKPCSFVCKISPVESVKYIENNKIKYKRSNKAKKNTIFYMAFQNVKRTPKKALSVILSLSLSIILLNTTITFVNGFDMDKYIQNTIISDFYITDASLINISSSVLVYDGINENDKKTISELDGITEIGNVYMKEFQHKLNDVGFNNAKAIYEKYKSQFPSVYLEEQKRRLDDEHIIDSHLYGIDEFVISKMEIKEGNFDLEKFKTGNYIIVTDYIFGDEKYYSIGDKVTIDYGNGNKKEYEVMAIGDIPFVLGPQHIHYFDVYFSMYSDEFIKQTGTKGSMKIAFNVEESKYETIEKWVENYCENINKELDYKSRTSCENEFKGMKNMFLIVGGILSFILALIGVLNFINSSITSVQTRRRELAMFQAIGMTGKQLKGMLISEGLCYTGLSFIFVLTIGNILTYLLVNSFSNQMWYFTYSLNILPILASIPVLLFFSIVIPTMCYNNMQKISVVDRLKIME